MDSLILFSHILLALIFALYLLYRLVRSLFAARDPEASLRLKRRFRYSDRIFGILILLAGLYPLIVLQQAEPYHLVKLLLLAGILYLSRRPVPFSYPAANLICVVLMASALWISFERGLPFRTGSVFFTGERAAETAALSDTEKGWIIYRDLCTTCHGEDGTLGRFQAADLTASTLTIEEKEEIISDGSPLTVMRPFSQELSEEEIAQVARYIHRVLGEQEPAGEEK